MLLCNSTNIYISKGIFDAQTFLLDFKTFNVSNILYTSRASKFQISLYNEGLQTLCTEVGFPHSLYTTTTCPRSSCPFYIVTCYIKWDTSSWTYSRMSKILFITGFSKYLECTHTYWIQEGFPNVIYTTRGQIFCCMNKYCGEKFNFNHNKSGKKWDFDWWKREKLTFLLNLVEGTAIAPPCTPLYIAPFIVYCFYAGRPKTERSETTSKA